MNPIKNHQLTGVSRALRRKMTAEERQLWYLFLKKLPITVNRQKVIGPYVVDFYCASAKTVIEIDGSGHYYHAEQKRDRERDRALAAFGLTVVRYSNQDIRSRFRDVCEDLYQRLIPDTDDGAIQTTAVKKHGR